MRTESHHQVQIDELYGIYGIHGIDQLSGSVPPKSQETPGAPDVRSFSHGFLQIISHYPLVNVYITMENHHVSWENPL